MPIRWRLKTYLVTKHGIFGATEFRKLIINKTGIIISLSNICKYLNKKPSLLSTRTLETFCTALNCDLKDFLEITPGKKQKGQPKKLSYKNTPNNKKGVKNFPDPTDYQD